MPKLQYLYQNGKISIFFENGTTLTFNSETEMGEFIDALRRIKSVARTKHLEGRDERNS